MQLLSGLKVCRAAPTVTHLFFADDSIIFSKATTEDCETILESLHLYECASGQKVNFEKSSCLFSSVVSRTVRTQILEATCIQTVAFSEKYLGLPTMVGRSKNGSLQSLKERVWKRVKGWKEKLLSKGGKEILIKAIAQSIPTYTMGCFKIP